MEKKFKVNHFNIKKGKNLDDNCPEFEVKHIKCKKTTAPQWEVKIPEQCDIVTPYSDSSLLPISDAIKKAMEFTRQTKKESGFLFDPKNGMILTPILSGCADKMMLKYSYLQQNDQQKKLPVGSYHTHHVYGDEDCFLSASDIRNSAISQSKNAILGCVSPSKKRPDDILYFDYNNIHPYDLYQKSEKLQSIYREIDAANSPEDFNYGLFKMKEFIADFKNKHQKIK